MRANISFLVLIRNFVYTQKHIEEDDREETDRCEEPLKRREGAPAVSSNCSVIVGDYVVVSLRSGKHFGLTKFVGK